MYSGYSVVCSLQSGLTRGESALCSAPRCQVLNKEFGGAFGGALGRDDEVWAWCCKWLV